MTDSHSIADLLEQDVEDCFPSNCEGDGGGAAFFMTNGPTVFISRNRNLASRIVPVYFIVCREGGADCSGKLLEILYEGSGEMAILRHAFEGKNLGKCVVVPFMFYRLPSAQAFCRGVENLFRALEDRAKFIWKMELSHVYYMDGKKEYKPSAQYNSLYS